MEKKELLIRSLAKTGNGCGYLMENGYTVPYFVPFTAPGDTITLKKEERKKKYVEAELKQILIPSPDRVAVACPHFTSCGGCNLLHVRYQKQVEEKVRILEHIFQRNQIRHPSVKSIIAEPNKNYRYKAKIFLGSNKEGHRKAGFRKRHSNELIPITYCDIIHPKIVSFLQEYNNEKLPARISTQIIALVDETTKELSLTCKTALDPEEETWLASHAHHFNKDITFHYTIGACTLGYNPSVFIQSHLAQNKKLVETVLKHLDHADIIYDLYAGIGNFTIPTSESAGTVYGVEGNEDSAKLMKENTMHNHKKNIVCVAQDTQSFLNDALQKKYPFPKIVILDPPRTGLGEEVAKQLLALSPAKMVYVACDPVALKDDVKILLESYAIEDVTVIDMFPHTEHFETVCVLTRKDMK